MTPARRRTLAAVALLVGVVCAGLGFWQVERLEERRAEVDERRARLARPPIQLGAGGSGPAGALARAGARLPPAESLAWRRAVAVGRFAYGREAVLAPRSWSGSPAVYLLTPLVLDESTALPVLRGAVPAPDGFHAPIERARPELDGGPDAASRKRTTTPDGDLTAVPDTAWGTLLPGPDRAAGAPPEPDTLHVGGAVYPVFAALDLSRIGTRFPGAVPDVYLHVESTTVAVPAGPGPPLPIRIPPPELDDGSHLSYAIQWFSFAAIALVGGGIVFFRGDGSDPRPA